MVDFETMTIFCLFSFFIQFPTIFRAPCHLHALSNRGTIDDYRRRGISSFRNSDLSLVVLLSRSLISWLVSKTGASHGLRNLAKKLELWNYQKGFQRNCEWSATVTQFPPNDWISRPSFQYIAWQTHWNLEPNPIFRVFTMYIFKTRVHEQKF